MSFNSIQDFMDHCRKEVLLHGSIKRDYLRSFFEILDDKSSIEKLRGITSPFLKLQSQEFETLSRMVNSVLISKAVAIEVDGVLIMHNATGLEDDEYTLFSKSGLLEGMNVTPAINKWDVSDSDKATSIKIARELMESLTPDPDVPKVEEPKSTIVYIEIPQ
jgi:hypothetical protein